MRASSATNLLSAALTIAILFTTSTRVFAHGVEIAQNGEGELKLIIEAELPVFLPPSPFPNIIGHANAEPGITAAEVDEPDEDTFLLPPDSFIQYELIDADPGLQIVTDHVWEPGETFDFGPPFFDAHFVYNIPDGEIGCVYTLRFRVRDLNDVLTGSPMAELSFTPVATTCNCRGDLNSSAAATGADVQAFLSCVVSFQSPVPPECACADMDGDGLLGPEDIDLFIDHLLESHPCS